MVLLGLLPNAPVDSPLVFCCTRDNDLYLAVSRAKQEVARFETVAAAIEAAKPGSGILILSGERESARAAADAKQKRLKVYVEMRPQTGDPVKQIEWERVIVTQDAFGPDLPAGRLLSIGRQPIFVVDAKEPILAVGRVAGFDRLAFGPPKQMWPLLWAVDADTWASSAPLSSFTTARYAPAKAWRPVWVKILSWLGAPDLAKRLDWQPGVRPSSGPTEKLPKNIETEVQKRAAQWFLKSHLVLSENDVATYAVADKWPDRVGDMPTGGSGGQFGILEGYSSQIDAKGGQPVRWYRRADCNAESAMALALANASGLAKKVGDFIALHSGVIHDDPAKESFGLIGWNDLPNNRGTFYGDDNARYILGLIGAAGALHDNDWDDRILKCIVANFRTTGVYGFRGDALGEGDIERLGWRHFFEAPTVNMAPHFEAYMWACYLWAYSKTGYIPFLGRTKKAIERVMTSGENAWTWTNGSQQERARMLLPLSWLVRVDDTAQHRAWLDDMARKVISYQADCGAIREEFGDLSHGIAGPPRSNEAYGTAETPLIQENGDPLADMLYTSNFAFLGLHEAAAVTKNPAYRRAEDKLAEFLCRIQIRSTTHPELDGAWFRAFDYGDWDYWASNADLGWGAWSIETGWSVSWISAVMGLRQRQTSLWDIHPKFHPNIGLIDLMIPRK